LACVLQSKQLTGVVSTFPVLDGSPGKGGRVMKSAASWLMAGALLLGLLFIQGAKAQNPPNLPNLPSGSKTDLKEQTPPAPVIAPLGVGTVFNAALDDTLDTHKTKAGDLIGAETAEDVNYEQCMIFPKGTKIMGHIIRVTSGGHGKAGSAIFVQFDKALMKDGQEVMLNAGIQALAVSSVAPMPSEADSARNAGAHAVPVEDNSGAAASNETQVVSTIYESPKTGLRPPLGHAPVAEGEFTSDGLFSPESRGAFGRPDLKIYTPTSEGSHGTVLLSARKNMRLDSGTHLLLVVQPPPSDGADSAGTAQLDRDPQ
jgi:hypothetical protein